MEGKSEVNVRFEGENPPATLGTARYRAWLERGGEEKLVASFRDRRLP